MKKDINSLDKLFSKVELYNKIDYVIFEKKNELFYLNKEVLKNVITVLTNYGESIDTFCIFHEKDYPFTTKIESSFTYYNPNYTIAIPLGDSISLDLTNYRLKSSKKDFYSSDELKDFTMTFLTYHFTCEKDKSGSHFYKMNLVVFFKKGVLTIQKIGQFPSMIDVWGFGFDQYKKQLDYFDAYQDFKKAELCMADHFSAGAYTYLRRVFEKLLTKYCEGKELENNKTETKIRASKDYFDDRVYDMLTSLYDILSKGIHILSDEESEEYYGYLRTVIELQLEYIKENNDKEEKTKHLKNNIDQIYNRIKK